MRPAGRSRRAVRSRRWAPVVAPEADSAHVHRARVVDRGAEVACSCSVTVVLAAVAPAPAQARVRSALQAKGLRSLRVAAVQLLLAQAAVAPSPARAPRLPVACRAVAVRSAQAARSVVEARSVRRWAMTERSRRRSHTPEHTVAARGRRRARRSA